VSIEMFHNAFLVHDDIEDESEYRRGMPTLHSEYGIGVAVNVGDAMNVLSIRPLMGNLSRLSPQITWAVFAEIEHMLLQSTEGQAMELGWVRDNACDLKEDDYLRMTLKKTCWYTCMHPCRIGYLIAQGDTSGLDRFNRFGYYMGAAFQITDDVLNLVGDRQKYGKEIGGDILEGKRTLTLVHCLNNSTRREKSRLKSFLATPRSHRTADDVDWVYTQFEKYGSIKYARSAARQLAGAALREFHVAFKDAEESAAKSFVREIILYMVDRDF
jgi:geranylgeranyl diphosphate synthase type II